jgi:hypothetical protein
MKKMMMIAAMMIAAVTVKAQQAGETFLKPMVGATLATVTNNGNDMKFGLVAGAEVGYMCTDNFGLTAGLLYTQQGAKADGTKNNLEYINVPVLANVYVAPGLALKAGVQVGFLTKAKAEGLDFKELCNKTDFSIPLGASYEFSDFVIDARYNLGLSNVGKDAGTNRNSVIMLTLGYKIPF